MFEDRTWMKDGVEIDYIVVACGRRRHGRLRFSDVLSKCRAGSRGLDRPCCPDSGGLGFDLGHVAGRGTVDGDLARLHRLGNSRCSSMTSRPFSKRAPLTSTWSASVN